MKVFKIMIPVIVCGDSVGGRNVCVDVEADTAGQAVSVLEFAMQSVIDGELLTEDDLAATCSRCN